MKFTLSWLKEYLDTNESLGTICQRLTDIGLEVEEVENKAESLELFTIAKIIEAKPHQDSDKLQICTVDVGQKENLQIICGAANARSGLKVVFAPIGSVIPINKMKIKKSNIRGVESHGMLCSAAEIGIGEDGGGIIEIDDKIAIGTKITEIYGLNDAIIEINITPNRGDCLGVYGIARDLASAGLGKLKEPKINNIIGKFDSPIKVEIKSNNCPYFSGYYIKDISNKQSPKWLKDRLESIGVNPISAVVDVTNYVMLCLNQPLHAYDADNLEGNIIVRDAKEGEKFISLKKEEHTLNGGELLICDNDKVAGLAGIIGGNSTATLENTKNVFLEAAFFEGTNIARTGRNLKILSDARYRFERNTDLLSVNRALDMAANLIVDICNGSISKIVESGSNKAVPNLIDFDLDKIKKILNVEISLDQVKKILCNLGFGIKDLSQNKLQVSVPSFRSDVKITEDLVEEVIRIYGYDKIESTSIPNIKYQEIDSDSNFNTLRTTLCNLGIDEIISWSFIDSRIANSFTKINDELIVANAISEEMDYMRPSLFPGLISALRKNQLRGFGNLSLFEIGKIFLGTNVDDQVESVCGVRIGKNKDKNHYKDDRVFDVMDSKKDLFSVLEVLGVNPQSVQIVESDSELPTYYHPYRSALVKIGKNTIGSFGEINPMLNKKFSIKGRINAFELFISKLPTKKSKQQKKAFVKSDFQVVNRDFAFIFDAKVRIIDLVKLVKNTNQELINAVSIFDVYEGGNIADNKKSIAFNVEIVPQLKTLNSQEIDEISNKIINVVSDKLNGNLRDN